MKALCFFYFFHLFYSMTNGIFVSLFNFVSLFMFLLSYLMYIKHKKCTLVHLQIDVLYLFNEIFI